MYLLTADRMVVISLKDAKLCLVLQIWLPHFGNILNIRIFVYKFMIWNQSCSLMYFNQSCSLMYFEGTFIIYSHLRSSNEKSFAFVIILLLWIPKYTRNSLYMCHNISYCWREAIPGVVEKQLKGCQFEIFCMYKDIITSNSLIWVTVLCCSKCN